MSFDSYYLAESAYVYPSSNANDGGEDNSEYNLKTITDKFAIQSFVVRRTGSWENYFLLSYSSSPIGVSVTGGECSINGYYLDLKNCIIPTRNSDGTSLLSPSVDYNIVVRIYKDGTGKLRGDGVSVSGVNNGKLESRGVTIGLYTDSELLLLDKETSLVLGGFTSDSNGDPPTDDDDYHLNEDRFIFLSSETIVTSTGDKIEEWVNNRLSWELAHLSQLNYYQHPDDEEPSSTLKLTADNKLIFESGDITFDIVEIEKRTHVAPSGQYTDLPNSPPDNNYYNLNQTYNGVSILLARADHNHDGRYIAKNTDGTAGNEQIVNSKLNIVGGVTTGPQESPNFTADSSGHITAAGGDFQVGTSGNVSTNGTITSQGNITSEGDITGRRVFNAVWNDYADAVRKRPGCETTPGDIICICKDSCFYEPSSKNNKCVVGVHSDTFGHLLGGQGQSIEEVLEDHIPIAVSGNVLVKVIGRVSKGDFITVSRFKGVGKKAGLFTKRGTIVGKSLEDNSKPGIKRVLMQVCLN